MRRPAWALLAGASALLLTACLSLLLSHFQALAQPAAEVAQANLDVYKDVNTAHAEPGDVLTYTITVQNIGDDSANAWLTDTLPAELTYVDGSLQEFGPGSAGFAGGVITWTGEIAGFGQTAVITFSAAISSEITYANIENTAQVTGTGELITDSAETLAQVAEGNLGTSTKSVQPDWASPGEQLVYTVRIANTGDGSVGVAWMTDTLPSEVDYAGSLNATTGSWGVVGDVITWTGSLTSSEVATVTFATQIKSTLSENTCFTNTAEITGAGTLVQAQVPARAVTHFDLYLPIIIRNYPPRPELNDIPAPGASNSYTVSWSSVSGADRYVLQEATDTNFTSVTRVFTATEASQVVSLGSSHGTLYYRVRADDDDRWGQGPWSDPESVEVPYFDDFSDSGSGWPKRATEVIPETDTHYRLRYEDSQYRIMIDPGGPAIWFHHPDALAPYRPPSDTYCVETMMKLEKNRSPYEGWDFYPYWANGGLVFGANEANTNIYALCVSVGGGDKMGWFIMNNPEYDFPHVGCAYQEGSAGGEDAGALVIGSWHLIQIGVNGDRAKVYIDGEYKGRWTMDGLGGTTRVGLIGGDYEVTPVDFRFDNFKVIPNAGCTTP